MLENLIFSLNSTMPLFLMMLLGFILCRTGFLGDGFVATANKFVYNVTLPVMLFYDLACADIRTSFDGRFLGFCVGVTVVSILGIWGLSRVLLRDKSLVGEFVQGSYRSSAAILGTAFIQSIYGTSTMGGLMLLGSVPLYNVFAVLILTLECPQPKNEGDSLGKKIWHSVVSILKNPTLIAIGLGLLASLIRLPLPTMVSKTMSSLGGITTPLALLIVGAGFKGGTMGSKLGPTVWATAVKLLILPAIFLPVAVLCGFTDQKLVALLVMLGSITTPSAYVMAKQMGHEGTLTARICAATTLFSAVTLTFWLFLARNFGYIL